jgi:predicted KAP-like P-loop ATPase
LSSTNDDKNTDLQNVKILTDSIEIEEKPFLGFENYVDTIVKMVKGSKPSFSVGVYGEWGTGKTTLMRLIEEKLKTYDEILPVWFNAWRYERENQFALIALMKTLAYAMGALPTYREVKKVLIRGLGIIGKDVLRQFALKYLMTDKGVEDFEKNLLPKMDLLSKVDKDTIYFEGMITIEGEMKKISKTNRIVVFIDDLDRCSPTKVLEVFESIKVFLDIEGFIYIIGLSHGTVSKLITAEYEKSGIKGENYIKKIVQIPLILPEWSIDDLEQFIEKVLAAKLDEPYSKIVAENKSLIASAVELNPREAKRFINSFIIAYEIFKNNLKPKELLVILALQVRWYTFYQLFSSEDDFRTIVRTYVYCNLTHQELKETLMSKERMEQIMEPKIRFLAAGLLMESGNSPKKTFFNEHYSSNIDFLNSKILTDLYYAPEDFKKELQSTDRYLWEFIMKEAKTTFEEIKDWRIYRHAAESIDESLILGKN